MRYFKGGISDEKYILWEMSWASFVLHLGAVPDSDDPVSKPEEEIKVMNAADAF